MASRIKDFSIRLGTKYRPLVFRRDLSSVTSVSDFIFFYFRDFSCRRADLYLDRLDLRRFFWFVLWDLRRFFRKV